ncbi:hypothetical protein NLC82_01235 [Candidatus Aminicenantes bacterium AC-335-A11]|jgi:hypothetical protein|nr:hypothetical protein [SCandidatus Aminicenantes bacterium Aminicenantia_JdfR_composite]MCP2597308.1 hypothetical protein [Candidatus Aminicenantes bacterium AC-335-G13]MCP2598102.1 hypothetical protein [Candidatus Aminicenantes bacterium AC-335-L06]MCP2606235.1 hypothetical protein [Candidatus Aminicenantes bacterium AC-708-I09]MCP2618026.1 hypothetical protein [Candidatus Aminicenantes bacterium AC-335-A11]
MALLVLAFPEISKHDYEAIQNYRKENDELYYGVVEPHFTIVFPIFDIGENEFISEIKKEPLVANK